MSTGTMRLVLIQKSIDNNILKYSFILLDLEINGVYIANSCALIIVRCLSYYFFVTK